MNWKQISNEVGDPTKKVALRDLRTQRRHFHACRI